MLKFLVAAAMILSSEPADQQAVDHKSLVAFADAFDRAQLSKDGAALQQMVADDLIFIDGSGVRRDKKEFIAGWTDPGDRYDPVTLVDRTVTLLGNDVGIACAEATLAGRSGGKAFVSKFRFSDIFHRSNGSWRAVHIQVTRIP